METSKRHKVKKYVKQYIGVTLGVIILDIAFYFFLQPSSIVTGGMMGVSILLEPVFNSIGSWFTASIFLYIINGITLILGLILLGKDFFLKTVYGTFLSPTVLLFLEQTSDPNFFMNTISEGNVKLISLICGSLLCGIGVGLAVKNNGSTGGMDVVQKIMSKYMHVPMSITMYLTDWVVVILAGFMLTTIADGVTLREYTHYYQIENVVFGSIGVFIQAYLIDYLCLGAKARRTVYVITNKPDEIKELIYTKMQRGVTFSNVIGGYTNEARTMVICTMDKNEAYRVTGLIAEADPQAFTFVTSCKEVRGEYDKRGIL